MEHVGGLSFFLDALAVLTNNLESANVFAGITSVLNKGKNQIWYLTRRNEFAVQLNRLQADGFWA